MAISAGCRLTGLSTPEPTRIRLVAARATVTGTIPERRTRSLPVQTWSKPSSSAATAQSRNTRAGVPLLNRTLKRNSIS